MKFLRILFVLLSCCAGQADIGANYPTVPEDQIRNLVDAYQKSQVLIISNSTHQSMATYLYLQELLKRIGKDENLRLLGIERLNEADEIMMKGSLKPLSELLPLRPITDPLLRLIVCEEKDGKSVGYGEWAYMFSQFLPFLSQLNHQRLTPIIARSFDGVRMKDVAPTFPQISLGNCVNKEALPVYQASRNREFDTAKYFMERILKYLGAKDKAIIVYHYWHATEGLQGCMGEKNSNGGWITNGGYANWLSILKPTNLGKKTNVVLIDEKNEDNPNGVLQYERPVKFSKDSFIRTYLGGDFNIDQINIEKVFKASLVVPDFLQIKYSSPKSQLPIHCS